MTWFYIVSENIAFFLECYILCCVYSLFFEKRFSGRKHWGACVLGGLALTFMLYWLNAVSLFSFVLTAVVAAVASLLALWLYRANFIQTLSVSVIYYVIIAAYDFLIVFIVELLYEVDNTVTIITEAGGARAAYIWFQQFSLIAVYLIARRRKRGRRIQMNNKVSLALIVSGMFCFFFMQFLINAVLVGDAAEIKKSVLIAWLFMLLFFAGLWILVAACSIMKTQRIERDVLAFKADTLEDNSIRLNRAYSEIAKVSHDFHNHLRVMNAMAEAGQYEELGKYLKMLADGQPTVQMRRYTGNEVVDAVLNNKADKAREMHVTLSIYAAYPEDVKIQTVDICALLVNLLDGALESAAEIPDPQKRFVEVSITSADAMLMILVKAHPQEAKRGDTARGAKRAYGCDAQMIRFIVDRYQGRVEHIGDGFCLKTRILLKNADKL